MTALHYRLGLVSLLTVAFSLFLLGSAMVIGEIVNKTVNGWESFMEISAFLSEDITPVQQEAIENSIIGTPEVRQLSYISKERAFEEYKEMFKDTPAVYENVDPSALPALYRIKLRNPNTAQAVSSRIDGKPGVDQVRYGGERAQRLLRINQLLRTMSPVLMVLLAAGGTSLLMTNWLRSAR